MNVLYVFIAVLSLPATLLLSNWYWFQFRETRAIRLLLGSPELLRRFVTEDVLKRPPAGFAQLAEPLAGGYALKMQIFQQAHRETHTRLQAIVRPALVAVVVGSGVVGFLGVGWLGLAFPVLNVLICNTTFVGSTQGLPIDKEASSSAVEHVKGLAFILHRWYRNSPREATEWLEGMPGIEAFGELVASPSEPARTMDKNDEHAALKRAFDPGEQRNQVEGATGSFGYERTNPIPADGNWYCRRLRCPHGHPYRYHRPGSVGPGPDGHTLDLVELQCFGGESRVELFFDMYHVGPSSLVPRGLSMGSEAGRGSTRGLASPFPEGLEEYDSSWSSAVVRQVNPLPSMSVTTPDELTRPRTVRRKYNVCVSLAFIEAAQAEAGTGWTLQVITEPTTQTFQLRHVDGGCEAIVAHRADLQRDITACEADIRQWIRCVTETAAKSYRTKAAETDHQSIFDLTATASTPTANRQRVLGATCTQCETALRSEAKYLSCVWLCRVFGGPAGVVAIICSKRSRGGSELNSMAKPLQTFLTRITWNDAQWRHPSQASGKAETNSYVADNGFGHEEWLNRSEWVIDGWRYGFLQGVSISRRKHSGEQVRILLYAVTPAKERRYVGELRRAELVDGKTMNAAAREMKRQGIVRKMADEVRAAGGNATVFREGIASDGLVNVRFRLGDLKFYAEPILASPSDLIQRYARYQLIEATKQARTEWKARTREALKELKRTEAETRTVNGGVVRVDLVENRLQNELRQLLQAQFGEECVAAEQDFVDLSVTTPKRRVLLEVKSDATAQSAIRSALGQLLDYAYFGKEFSEKMELVIVGQGASTPESTAYLQLLTATFRIPIRYQQFQLGKKDFAL